MSELPARDIVRLYVSSLNVAEGMICSVWTLNFDGVSESSWESGSNG